MHRKTVTVLVAAALQGLLVGGVAAVARAEAPKGSAPAAASAVPAPYKDPWGAEAPPAPPAPPGPRAGVSPFPFPDPWGRQSTSGAGGGWPALSGLPGGGAGTGAPAGAPMGPSPGFPFPGQPAAGGGAGQEGAGFPSGLALPPVGQPGGATSGVPPMPAPGKVGQGYGAGAPGGLVGFPGQPRGPMGAGPGMGAAPGAGGADPLAPFLALDLSDDQRSRIGKLSDELRKKQWELQGKRVDREGELRKLSDEQRRLTRAIAEIESQMGKTSSEAVTRAHELLTDPQRERLSGGGAHLGVPPMLAPGGWGPQGVQPTPGTGTPQGGAWPPPGGFPPMAGQAVPQGGGRGPQGGFQPMPGRGTGPGGPTPGSGATRRGGGGSGGGMGR